MSLDVVVSSVTGAAVLVALATGVAWGYATSAHYWSARDRVPSVLAYGWLFFIGLAIARWSESVSGWESRLGQLVVWAVFSGAIGLGSELRKRRDRNG